jgi:hypothetical protein
MVRRTSSPFWENGIHDRVERVREHPSLETIVPNLTTTILMNLLKCHLEIKNAQTWLQVRLTIANNFATRYKSRFKPTPRPSIWLLTGIYLISNASHDLVKSNSSNSNTTLKIPISDPSGTTALLNLSIGGSVSNSSDSRMVESAKIKEEKV